VHERRAGFAVLLASREDEVAARFVSAHHDAGFRLLTADDLSVCGWQFATRARENSAVISGQQIATERIDGVIARLPTVRARDVAKVVAPEDREYAAAEMTAFLAAWLAALDPKVINPPSPVCLTGTAPTRAVLRRYASRAGIELAADLDATTAVSCVDRVPITQDEMLVEAAAAVCEAAGESLARIHLTVTEAGCALAGYDHNVDLDDPKVGAAVLSMCR
jgi:hypothetical protein